MRKITPQNCNDILDRYKLFIDLDITGKDQAAAWLTVYNFCLQNGMIQKFEKSSSGIKDVISFINKLLTLSKNNYRIHYERK